MKTKEVKMVLIVVACEQRGEVREDGRIVSKSDCKSYASKSYRDNFDAVFNKNTDTNTVN